MLAAVAFAAGLAAAPKHPVQQNESLRMTFEEKRQGVPDYVSFVDYKYDKIENMGHNGLHFAIERRQHEKLRTDVNNTHNSNPYTV